MATPAAILDVQAACRRYQVTDISAPLVSHTHISSWQACPLLLGSVTNYTLARVTLNILSSAFCRNWVSMQALWKPWVVQGKRGFLDSLILRNDQHSVFLHDRVE